MPDLDFFGGTGFQLLDEKSVKVQKDGEEIFVSGLTCERPGAYLRLLENVPANRFSIFLYHNSDLVEDLENLNVDLYLCGHTHGGQVQLPFYGALVTLSKFGKKYEAGMFTVNDTILYVNRGIGLEGGLAPRVRFLARPEITVFDIIPKEQPGP
jgi:predicted MPP superfamily phosphohydrolase